jgi:hypothetical protein
MGDDPGEPRSTSFGGRLRSAAGPLLVTLGAGALAFAGIVGVRALAGGAGPEPLRAALKRALPVIDGDAGQGAPSTLPAPSLDDLGLLAEQRKVPLNVTFSSELLPLPAGFRLRPGHGLLEVRTWEPQRIYVDGVFMGNYETRLIPLNPGTYQLRLRDGARDMERSVQVEAGRRTRLWARPKSPQ